MNEPGVYELMQIEPFTMGNTEGFSEGQIEGLNNAWRNACLFNIYYADVWYWWQQLRWYAYNINQRQQGPKPGRVLFAFE